MAQTRLLVCSIGNPGAYLNTLHSAGHIVLSSLAAALSYPSFQKSKVYGNGLISEGPDFTLWQSSSLMNISGAGVAKAWRQFQKEASSSSSSSSSRDATNLRLIVIHDELQLPLGQVKIKNGRLSPAGHNGLKSIRDSLGGVDYTRIGVGIGRPESRDPEVVASYVLRKMTGQERNAIEASTGRVELELRQLLTSGP